MEEGWCEECKSKIKKVLWGGADRERALLELGHCHHPKEVQPCKWCESYEWYRHQPRFKKQIVYLITRGEELTKCPECGKDIK